MIDIINLAILVGAGLVVVSIFTSLFSFRIGVPLLLVFLAVGLAAGEDGLGGIDFDNAPIAYFIGSMALAVILFDSGFNTQLLSYRLAAWPALTLATFGVLMTTGLFGAAARLVLDLDWVPALLLGAIVSSTDAAAVFLLLRVGGITIRDRVRSTLEIESGSNDPMAIFLTLSLATLMAAGASVDGGEETIAPEALEIAGQFVVQLLFGAIGGIVGGAMIVHTVNRVRLEEGLYPLVVSGLALFVFAATSILGGSGFLAVYVAGLIAGNVRLHAADMIHKFQTGLTWLGQISMFLTLGLLATPSSFGAVAVPAAILSFVLIFVARPLAVWICLLPFRFTKNEVTFISWVGLRGAVSILLAIVPILNGLPIAQDFFNIAFILVLVSLMLQGWTIRPMARWLGLVVPPRLGPVDRVELPLPGETQIELVTYVVAEGSDATSKRLPRWARPSLLMRDGKVVDLRVARGLRGGDRVYFFATPKQIQLLDRLFSGRRALDIEDRDFFGDFAIEGDAVAGEVAVLYDLPIPSEARDQTLADLFAREFGHQVEVGDRLHLGGVDLIARVVEDGIVGQVGIDLTPAPSTKDRLRILMTRDEVATVLRKVRQRTGVAVARRITRRRPSETGSPPDRTSDG